MSDPVADFIASGGIPNRRASSNPTPADFPRVDMDENAPAMVASLAVRNQEKQTGADATSAGVYGNIGSADPLEKFIASGGSSISLPRQSPQPLPFPAHTGMNQPSPLDETAANFLTGVGANIVGGYQGLTKLATGGSMDEAANAVKDYVAEHTYQPQTEGGKSGVAAMASDYNPLNWIPKAAEWAGGKTTDVASALGASPATAAAAGTAVNVGVNAAPMLLGLKPGEAAPAIEAPAPTVKPRMTYAEWQAQKAGETAPAPQATAPQAPVGETPTPAPAPSPTPATAAPVVEAPTFSEPAKSTAGTLPPAQQAERAAVLQRIGAPEDVRESAVTGDAGRAATELQMSRLTDDPVGEVLKSRLAAERQALIDHSQKIVQDTGGTLGMDETDLQGRGATILAPVDALKDWFDNEISKQYGIARDRAQGQPVSMNTVAETLGKESTFQGNTDSLQLRKGVQARMKELGMTDDEGNIVSSTVDQAENLRKYLNEQWSPKAGKAVSALKDAIDDDVTGAAGEDTFKAARAIRAARAVTLDDPKGIAKLIDQEGLNRAVYAAKTPDYVTSLPPEQLSHIVKTLQNLPEGLQPMGDAALAEIKAHFANKALQTGNSTAVQWNAKGVANYLSKNAEKLSRVFTPEELAPFKDLNDAGNILHIDPTYPGAYVQKANLMKRGVMAALPATGAAVGGTIGGTAGSVVGMTAPGAAVGAALGGKLGAGMSERMATAAALKQVQKGTVKLSDFPQVGRR